MSDIQALRSIGRKSINKFDGTEIKKSEKWARRFYKELGTKSPFFRAWFGDWRAYDYNTAVKAIDKPSENKNVNTITNSVPSDKICVPRKSRLKC